MEPLRQTFNFVQNVIYNPLLVHCMDIHFPERPVINLMATEVRAASQLFFSSPPAHWEVSGESVLVCKRASRKSRKLNLERPRALPTQHMWETEYLLSQLCILRKHFH